MSQEDRKAGDWSGEGGSPPKYPSQLIASWQPQGEKGESGCAAKPLREGAAIRVLFPEALRRHLGSPPTPLAAPAPPSFLPVGGGEIGQRHPGHLLPSKGGGHNPPPRESPATNCLLRSAPQQIPRGAGDRGPRSASAAPHKGQARRGPKPPRETDVRKKASGEEEERQRRPTSAPPSELRSPAEPGGRIPRYPFCPPQSVLLLGLTC